MACCMVCSICACIASTCSRVGGVGGSGLTSLLFLALFLAAQFLVLAIWSTSVDEIKNTQKNGSNDKGIVANPQK
jgi:hypothetical protein